MWSLDGVFDGLVSLTTLYAGGAREGKKKVSHVLFLGLCSTYPMFKLFTTILFVTPIALNRCMFGRALALLAHVAYSDLSDNGLTSLSKNAFAGLAHLVTL